MIVSPAADIRERVSALQIAERYGMPVDPGGFALCPWHREGTPSLKLYPGTRGCYCFGCHASGDAIALARKLLGTSFRDTLFTINRDFGLGIELDGRPSPHQCAARLRYRRERAERLAHYEAVEAAYLDALDEWVRASSAVERSRPRAGDEPFSEDFCRALMAREAAEIDLEEAEGAWTATKLQA